MIEPTTIDEVCEAVRTLPKVRVRGGGTKTALSGDANVSLGRLAGMLEYQPEEFTFTALAGTPVAAIRDELAAHGQYLPFDPPWTEAGATLGGTVAAGLSGSGRFRYGGLRDFILGVRVVTGEGRMVRGGGKVVKNAAGFDIPKLMVGSLGQLGVLVELTFKVFPAPAATATLSADFGDVETAVSAMDRLATSGLDLMCLDYEPPTRLWLRLGGLADALPRRFERVREFVGSAAAVARHENDAALWHAVGEFAWVPGRHAVVKLPVAPRQILELETQLQRLRPEVARRYSVGGNIAWLGWPIELGPQRLAEIADTLARPALVLRGEPLPAANPEIDDNPFLTRLRTVFDPHEKFGQFQQRTALA